VANAFELRQRPPDPLKQGIGRPLLSQHAAGGAVQDLLRSSNWCAAWGATASRVSQGWGGGMATVTAAMPSAGTFHGNWRIPRLGPGYVAMEVGVWAEFTGAGPNKGQVRFRALESGNTATIDVPAGAAGLQTKNLAIQGVTGEETIEMTIAGDGASPTILHEAFVEYVPLTSPLAAGVIGGAAGRVTPFDEDETDPDSALSADEGTHLIDNYEDFYERERVYFQWTALSGINDYMENFEHQQWMPVHPGVADAEDELQIRVNATGLAGEDSRIYLYFGHEPHQGHPGVIPLDTVLIEVAAGAARDWYSATYSLRELYQLHRMPHPFTHVAIFPSTPEVGLPDGGCRPFRGADAGNKMVWGGPFGMDDARPQNGGYASPKIHAVSMWGL
jgi:hypothetical protein